MKTEQLLLIIGAAFLLFRNRQTTLTLGNTNQRQNMQGGASGQPGNTGTMFGGTASPGQTAGQGTPGGGPATDRGSVWDRVTIGDLGDVGKGLGDFFGGLFK